LLFFIIDLVIPLSKSETSQVSLFYFLAYPVFVMKEERMDTRKSFKSRFNKIAVNILSIFTVLAFAIPATGGAFAEDGSPYL